MTDVLSRLEATIAARRDADPATSYVAALFTKGLPKIAQKLGEEAVETVIAALDGGTREITSEAADLIFHLHVLLSATGVAWSDVLAELERREGQSGIEEKAGRREPARAAAPAPEPAPSGAARIAPGGEASAPAKPRPLIRKG